MVVFFLVDVNAACRTKVVDLDALELDPESSVMHVHR